MSGSVEHTNCLTDIVPDIHSVEKYDEGVEFPLQPFRFSGREHTILRVEEGSTVNHLPHPLVLTYRTS